MGRGCFFFCAVVVMAQEVAEMAEAEQRLLGQDPDAGKESSEIEDYLSSDSPQPTSSSI
jgi:hypothetical protein